MSLAGEEGQTPIGEFPPNILPAPTAKTAINMAGNAGSPSAATKLHAARLLHAAGDLLTLADCLGIDHDHDGRHWQYHKIDTVQIFLIPHDESKDCLPRHPPLVNSCCLHPRLNSAGVTSVAAYNCASVE